MEGIKPIPTTSTEERHPSSSVCTFWQLIFVCLQFIIEKQAVDVYVNWYVNSIKANGGLVAKRAIITANLDSKTLLDAGLPNKNTSQ